MPKSMVLCLKYSKFLPFENKSIFVTVKCSSAQVYIYLTLNTSSNITRYRRQRYGTQAIKRVLDMDQSSVRRYLFARHSNIATQHFALSYRFFLLTYSLRMYFHICILSWKSEIQIATRFDKRTTSANSHAARRYDIYIRTIACLIIGILGQKLNYASCRSEYLVMHAFKKNFVFSAIYERLLKICINFYTLFIVALALRHIF